MAGQPFRVLFDLTDLNLNGMTYVWIYVSPSELEKIYDLKMHVLRRINVVVCVQDVELFLQNRLLFDEEAIAILKDNDTVKMKCKTPVCQNGQERANSSRKRKHKKKKDDEDKNSKRYRAGNSTSSPNITAVENASIQEKDIQSKPCHSVRNYPSSLEEDNQICQESNEKKKERKSSNNDKKVTNTDICRSNDSFNLNTAQEQKQSNKALKIVLSESEQTQCSSKSASFKEDELIFPQNKSSEGALTAVNSSESSRNNQSRRKRRRSRKRKQIEVTTMSRCDLNDNLASFSEKVNENMNEKDILCLTDDQKEKKRNLINDAEVNPSDTAVLKEEKLAQPLIENCTKMSTPPLSNHCVNDYPESFSENVDSDFAANNLNDDIEILSGSFSNEVEILSSTGNVDSDDLEILSSTDTLDLKEYKLTYVLQQDCPVPTPAQSTCSIPDLLHSVVPSESLNLLSNDNDSILCAESATKNTLQSYEVNESEKPSNEEFPDKNEFEKSSHEDFADKNEFEKSSHEDFADENKFDVSSYEDFADENESEKLSHEVFPDENESQRPLYEEFPDITSLPVVGAHIAYKVLELDNYSPVPSDYREGVVEEVIPDTDEVHIRLTKELILPGKSGKFENLRKGEVPEPVIKKYEVLTWTHVIKPKFLGYSSK